MPICQYGQHCKHQAALLFAVTDGSAAVDDFVQLPRPPKAHAKTSAYDFQPDPTTKLSSPVSSTLDENFDRRFERWKRELLDTSKRNKMINYRETKRTTLRILEPEASELFNRLAFSEKPLTFQKPVSKDADRRTYSMIALMETLSYTLNVHSGDIKTAGTIAESDNTLKNLRAKAKLAREEQGANILYLCFGFIYWREQNREGSPWLKSPLLMMPVSLGLKSLSSPYTINRCDDDIEVNPTLAHLFNAEYRINLPAFDLKNGRSFNEYLAQVETLADKRGWKVAREVSLGLFSFQKISMYHDLDNNRELIVSHPVIRAMVGDTSALGALPAHAESFDFDGVKPGEWHEVVDADSSQEEAILLSKLGFSFVMQGPPGTGKSQTITNIIAEALADGKKVLFVSEKVAALQVVLKRLTEVCLADFYLPLHDYKASKKQIVDSIGANLRLDDEYADGSSFKDLTRLFRERNFLNTYASELHRHVMPLDQSVYMAFGQLAKLEHATALEFSINNPAEVSKDEYASILYCVSAYEKALRGMDGKLSDNPWFRTKATSPSQIYKTQLMRETDGLSASLRRLSDLSGGIAAQLGVKKVTGFSDVRKLFDISGAVISMPSYMSRTWFNSDISARGQKLLGEARRHADRLRRYNDIVLSSWNDSVLSIDTEKIQNLFCGGSSWIYISEGDAPIEKRLAEQKEAAEGLKKRIKEMLSAYHAGLQTISYNQPDTAGNIRMLHRVLRLIAEAPYMQASWFDPRRNTEIAPLIKEAARHSASVTALRDELLKNWEPTVFNIDADGMLNRFKTEYVGLFHTWKSGYKEDIKTLRLHSRAVGLKISELEVIEFLRKLKELNAEKAWFTANEEALSAVMGNQCLDATANWSRVCESMSKAREITNEFPYASIPEETVAALLHITDSLQLSGEAFGLLEEELRSCRCICEFSDDCDIAKDVLPKVSFFIDNLSMQTQYAAEFVAAKNDSTLFYEDIVSLLSNVAAVQEELAWFDETDDGLKYLLAGKYMGAESDWDAVSNGLTAASRLVALFEGAVPETIVRIACDQDAVGASFCADVSELSKLAADTEPKIRAFSAQFDSDDFEAQSLSDVADHYDACMDGFDKLSKWLDYVETRTYCDAHGLSDFTARIADLDNTVLDVQTAFERGFYVQWLNQQLPSLPAIQSFRRRTHEQRAENFAKLDTKQREIAKMAIRERVISAYPDFDCAASAGSELTVLKRELVKKSHIMPLRRLFRTIPKLLTTLKPCFMMSPLSVAYFLDADVYRFDMVIFDEASQIFPQDAIGAIFRAKQVIIAGDTKQLPPTNFFAASTGNDDYDYDEASDEEVYDSILEEASNILPNRTLLWHYRSRHEHLIAFSNQEIYQNALITFPSSNESEPDTGVEFVHVDEGYYEPFPQNRNVPEARRIVELVKEHIEKHPNRSLGIIAFSEKQQRAISLEIQRFREKHSKYEAFFAEDREDEFFVKNLENVQGDERDTIFFSVGYAKTKEQKANGKPMAMRFGPLGVSGGERRLNVAITRARINIKLVSSILPSDIDLSKMKSDGIRMFRSYMEFAMNGETALATAHKNVRPDDFADSIARFVREQGFKVQQYVGCSGYKIDIAVKHPSDSFEQFIAGIECDGYSYASAKTARDRDRLRSSVLKNMGWRLYRVWSAEWYKNPEVEGWKLVAFLQESIEDCSEKINVLDEQRRKAKETRRLEFEQAKAAREVDQQRAQVATLKAARKNTVPKVTSEAAASKAEQTKAPKREKERSQDDEHRRRESEAKRQQNDLAWFKPGALVKHASYGAGIILAIDKAAVKVRFGQNEIMFSYPDVFESGTLVKPAAIEPQAAKVPEWAVIGAAVSHRSLGNGVIEAIDGGHMSVRFGSDLKTFLYPGAFADGHLAKADVKSAPVAVQMELLSNRRGDFVAYLCDRGHAKASAKSVAAAVSKVGDYALIKGFINTSIFDIDDAETVRKAWALLEKDGDFIRLVSSHDRRFTPAMVLYLAFLSSAKKDAL